MKRMRLAMKPYSSRASRTGVLPIARAKSIARMTASSAVCGPGTTSTSAISSAGLKKWMLRKRSGLRHRTPRGATRSSVDEFVPMMAVSSACAQIRPYTSRLMSRSSATDSMITSRAAPPGTRSDCPSRPLPRRRGCVRPPRQPPAGPASRPGWVIASASSSRVNSASSRPLRSRATSRTVRPVLYASLAIAAAAS